MRQSRRYFFRLFSFARFDYYGFVLFDLSFRLLDVCHGQLERDRQLVLFLVFEHLEEDLAGYLVRIGSAGMPARTIQVRHVVNKFIYYFSICWANVLFIRYWRLLNFSRTWQLIVTCDN